jgi:hypothetical protein
LAGEDVQGIVENDDVPGPFALQKSHGGIDVPCRPSQCVLINRVIGEVGALATRQMRRTQLPQKCDRYRSLHPGSLPVGYTLD